jgi:hypothetical protein
MMGAALIVMAAPAFAQGGGGRFFGGGFGGGAFLLRMPEVQKELKIDEAQKDLLDQLNMEMMQKGRELFQNAQNLSNEERMAKFQAFQAETTKKTNEILNPTQQKRLKELEIQQAGARSLGRPDVQTALKLTDDQKAKIKGFQDASGEKIRALFQNGGFQNPENRTKMQEINNETNAQLLGVLTDAQKKQFTEMQGAPFKFPEFRPRQRNNNNNNANANA